MPAVSAIPADVVFLSDTYDVLNLSCNPGLSTERCLQAVADHSPGGTASYTPSTLAPDLVTPIVSIDQQSSNAPANAVMIGGTVLAPNALVMFKGGANANHALGVSGGIVADSIVLAYDSPSAAYLVGVVDEAIQRRFDLVVGVASPDGGKATSRAVLDVNADGNYAINAWSVDRTD